MFRQLAVEPAVMLLNCGQLVAQLLRVLSNGRFAHFLDRFARGAVEPLADLLVEGVEGLVHAGGVLIGKRSRQRFVPFDH